MGGGGEPLLLTSVARVCNARRAPYFRPLAELSGWKPVDVRGGVCLVSAHSRSFLDGSPLMCVVACALFPLSRGAFWMEARRFGWIHVAAVSSAEIDLRFEIDRKGVRSSSKK